MNNWFKKNISSPIINALGKKKEERVFSKPPILIGGCGRSGTTLLLSMISAHPGIFCFPHEVDAFTEWERDQQNRLIPVRQDRMYRHLLKVKVPDVAHRWCEKRPFNVLYLPEILEYFPKARFIHLVRDPRDVLTSRHPERPDQFWITPKRYIRDVTAGLGFSDHPRVLTLKYEDLVTDATAELVRICSFLEEDYPEEMEDWFSHAKVRKNRAWFGKTVNPLHQQSLKKWDQPQYQSRINEILAYPGIRDLMDQLGYH